MRSRGGLWLDAKSGYKGRLEDNLRKYFPLPPLVFSHWPWPNQHENIPEDELNLGEIQNWVLMSAPNHPLWDIVLDAICTNIESYTADIGVGKQAVLLVTGPIALSRAVYPRLHLYPHVLASDKDLGFLYDVLGGHAKKQAMIGGGTHYSKVKCPVVLPLR